MPQHPGYHPFSRIWVLQLAIQYKGFASTTLNCTDLKIYIFTTEKGYLDYKSWIPTQSTTQSRYISIRADYGEQKWYNDLVWIQQQATNMFINGNFIPNLSP
jgi:hypothetical protein